MPLVVQISIFCKLCKDAEKSWKPWKKMVIFEFPTLKLVYICENIVNLILKVFLNIFVF